MQVRGLIIVEFGPGELESAGGPGPRKDRTKKGKAQNGSPEQDCAGAEPGNAMDRLDQRIREQLGTLVPADLIRAVSYYLHDGILHVLAALEKRQDDGSRVHRIDRTFSLLL